MRTGVLLAVLAGAALARAEPAHFKAPPPETPVDVLRLIGKAEVLERQHLYSEAGGWYHDAMEKAPDLASTYFNLGRIWTFRESPGDAVDAYKKYLALAPKATDRAAVQKLIDALEHRAPALTVEARDFANSDPADVILLDGVVMGPAPLTLHPTIGTHVIERIGPNRYARDTHKTEPGLADQSTDPSREVGTTKGNVVIDGIQLFENQVEWTENGVTFATGRRIQLPIGHYKTLGKTRDDDKPLCKAVEFDVRSTTELLHVHITTDDAARHEFEPKCVPVKSVILNTPLRGVNP